MIAEYLQLFKTESRISDIIWRYYSNSFDYAWRMENPHHHDAVEFIYIVEGGCRLHFPRNVINPSKNDLIVVSSNSVHSCEVTDKKGCTLINIHLLLKNTVNPESIAQDFFSPFFELIYSTDSFARFFNCIDIRTAIKNIVSELEQKCLQYEKVVLNDIEKMIIMICRQFNSRKDLSLHTGLSRWVNKALNFIENSITEDLDAGLIADGIHISRDYLMHLFKDELNMPLMEFVRRKKIGFAQVLLESTDFRIIDIAVESGFRNAQHFSTLFKRYSEGLSPSEYRKISRQLNNRDKNIFK